VAGSSGVALATLATRTTTANRDGDNRRGTSAEQERVGDNDDERASVVMGFDIHAGAAIDGVLAAMWRDCAGIWHGNRLRRNGSSRSPAGSCAMSLRRRGAMRLDSSFSSRTSFWREYAR
jgi:hypothetical protein